MDMAFLFRMTKSGTYEVINRPEFERHSTGVTQYEERRNFQWHLHNFEATVLCM
jgi:hypothetical protein